MARKKLDIKEELKRIEDEERAIYREEKGIERKEDLVRVFEELGLMRWKSYYVLTAGAILLLALTFVTSLWVMHDQILNLQSQVNAMAVHVSEKMNVMEAKIDNLSSKVDEMRSAEDSHGDSVIMGNIVGVNSTAT